MHVLIIGAGIIGLSCAVRLAEAGATVTLFDAHAAGGGATSAALGALWPLSPQAIGPVQVLQRDSLWLFEPFVRHLEQTTGLPIRFHRLGRLELMNSKKAEARAADDVPLANAQWPQFAAPLPTMELVSPADLATLYPTLTPQQWSAVRCRATAHIHVPDLLAALRARLAQLPISLHEHTPILSLSHTYSRITTAHTAQGPHEADAFLITAGAWSPLVGGKSLPDLPSVATVRPAKGQAIALARPPHFPLNTILKASTLYILPFENELLIGSTNEPDSGFNTDPTPAARDTLHAGAAALFPELARAPVTRHWTGLRPENPNKGSAPIMGPHPSIPNLHLCTAHYKTGIALCPLASAMMSSVILREVIPTSLEPFLPRASLI